MVAKNESNTSDREIRLSRVVHFPRELVWDAMTNPKHVVNWWGPRGFTDTIEKMDLRPGGTWKHTMRGPDGIDYPNHSTFLEVEKPSRVVFINGGKGEGMPEVKMVSTWTFDEVEKNKTRVTIHMVFDTPEMYETVVKKYGAVEGGKQCLIRLGEFLIRRGEPFVIERTYSQSVAQVWPAISTRAGIEKWFFDFIGFQPEVGNEFSFAVEHNGNKFEHLCVITEIAPERKIAFTWRYDGHEGDSLVTIELFSEDGGTRLKLTHEGLDNFPKLPQFDRGNFEKGWTSLIGTELPNSLA